MEQPMMPGEVQRELTRERQKDKFERSFTIVVLILMPILALIGLVLSLFD